MTDALQWWARKKGCRIPSESIKLEPLHFTGNSEYTVKKVIGFPVPRRDLTNQTLPGGGSKFNIYPCYETNGT